MLAWHAGLLQSASAFMVSWLAVLAYQKVTRTVPKKDRGYFWVLLIVIVVIFFGFFGGVVLDCTSIFSQQFGVSRIEALMAADFWHTVLANVKNIDYWGQYYSSMLLAAFFGGLGLSGLAKQLMGTNNK